MFSLSVLSIPSFEPGVVVPIDGLVHRVSGNDPGAVADEFAEHGCGHVGDQLLEGGESSEPGDTEVSEPLGQISCLLFEPRAAWWALATTAPGSQWLVARIAFVC